MVTYRSVIGIDPGNTTGWAIFFDGLLVGAGTLKKDAILPSTADDPVEITFGGIAPAAAVIELPRVYPHGGKGDPNDLIDLAVLAGDLAGFYRRAGFHVELVPPRTWKGTVPKAVHNVRVIEALSAGEIETMPRRPRAKNFDHNMIDAVGLGLWFLRRTRT